MKTLLITLLLIASSIFSINSFANTNNSSAEESSLIATNVLAIEFNDYAETLAIEDWMYNDAYWKNTNEITIQFEFEKELQIEEWMTNSDQWRVKKVLKSNLRTIKNGTETVHQYQLKKEKEKALRIENWMTNDTYWNM